MDEHDSGNRPARRRVDADKVSSKDLTAAYRVAAALVAKHGDTYLPLFERLDNELRLRDEKQALYDRAVEIAQERAYNKSKPPTSTR